jgi:hypothetical protein
MQAPEFLPVRVPRRRRKRHGASGGAPPLAALMLVSVDALAVIGPEIG